MNYRRWLIVGYMLALMAFTTSVLLIPGQKYDTLTTSDSGWVYDTAVEIDKANALAENNPLSRAPYGLPIPLAEQVQPLATVMLYRGISAINPSVTLMDVVKYWAPLIFALSLIPIFLIGRELGGDLGGCAAAFFAATLVSPIYWHKVGAYDREPIQLLLGAWAIFLTVKLFKAPRHSIPKFALLSGLVYGLFGLAWGGWHYVIAIMISGFLLVLLAGFLGKLVCKRFDLFGAIFSAVRGHLDLLAGMVGTMVVITLVLWVLGGQSPLFWVGIFQTYAGYLGLGGAGGISFTRVAGEEAPPSTIGEVTGGFYAADILTAFILILIGIALVKFLWSRKRWELLIFAWLVILLAMVWPEKGQIRFERLWWAFVPVLAGVGMATLISLVRRLSLEPSGEWLKHFQNPIVLVLVIGIIAAPFVYNAYHNPRGAYNVTPPTEWHIRGLDEGFMETIDWLRETPEDSVVSIQWSFGHLFTGAARRATVVDGAGADRGKEGVWENEPALYYPPDYIYYEVDGRGLTYGVDVSAKPHRVNGRRIDVQRFPRMDENEFRWLISTYRDNYGCKIDYVIFDYAEYCSAWWNQLLKKTTNSLQTAGDIVVFRFDKGRDNIVLDQITGVVYRERERIRENLWGYSIVLIDRDGNQFLFDRNMGVPFWIDRDGRLRVSYVVSVGGRLGDYLFRQSQIPSTQEALTVIYFSPYNYTDARFGFEGAVIGAAGLTSLETQQLGMGIRVFEGVLGGIDYLEVVFTSSNNRVKVFEVHQVPALVSPTDGARTNDTTPEFRWSGALGAVKYELWVDNDEGFTSPEIQENLTGTTYTAATGVLTEGNYSWQVGAYDAEDNFLGWSDVSTFVIDTTPPEAPVLQTPDNEAETSDNTPTFEWFLSAGAVNYRLVVDNEFDFSSPAENILLGATDNTYTLITELPPDTYYWYVTAIDEAGNENTSPARWFAITSPGA